MCPVRSPITRRYNMFDRFSRVARSNLNNVLKKLEDPEKVMEQALADMQDDLVKVRQSYAEVAGSTRRMERELETLTVTADEWKARAETALRAGEEELAKEALVRRRAITEKTDTLQANIESQGKSMEKLREGMESLQSAILANKAKKDEMVARARTAQSTKKVNDLMSGVGGKGSVDAWERMQDKVESLEAEAEVSEDMKEGFLGLEASSSGDPLLDSFKKLESGTGVDDELEQMKKMLNPGKDE